jgi:hypothetical protein
MQQDCVRDGALEKFPGRSKKNDFKSDGLQQSLDGGAHGGGVVNDNHNRVACRVRRHGRKMPSTPMPAASLEAAFAFQDFETVAPKVVF